MRLLLCPPNASAIRVLGRKLGFVVLALSLTAAAWAGRARENGCRHSNDRAAGCASTPERRNVREGTAVRERTAVSVPEPGAIAELVLGMAGAGLGFVALRRRKTFKLE